MNSIERKIILQQLCWIAGGLALSVAINFGMYSAFGDAAFPANIIVLAGIFLALGFYIQRRAMRRMGMLSGSSSGFSFGKAKGKGYECSRCGTLYKGVQCPKCGARGGKMVFGE
jgi:hypothetical protein